MSKIPQTPEEKRIENLENALRDILFGMPLDDVGNRNDNGLNDRLSGPGPHKADVRRWAGIARNALNKVM